MGRASNRKHDPAHRAEMNARRLRRIKRSIRSRKASELAMAQEAAREGVMRRVLRAMTTRWAESL